MTTAVKKIKEYLKKNDRSVAWLAREIGVNRATVFYWLNNERVAKKADVRRKLKEICGIMDDWV